jgi:hypothetical protein
MIPFPQWLQTPALDGALAIAAEYAAGLCSAIDLDGRLKNPMTLDLDSVRMVLVGWFGSLSC